MFELDRVLISNSKLTHKNMKLLEFVLEKLNNIYNIIDLELGVELEN